MIEKTSKVLCEMALEIYKVMGITDIYIGQYGDGVYSLKRKTEERYGYHPDPWEFHTEMRKIEDWMENTLNPKDGTTYFWKYVKIFLSEIIVPEEYTSLILGPVVFKALRLTTQERFEYAFKAICGK